MLPPFSVAWAVPADTKESKNAPAQRGHWFRPARHDLHSPQCFHKLLPQIVRLHEPS